MLALEQTVLTISELNARARQCIEDEFQVIAVMGELSNVACPSSGHQYFSLKDDKAQVRCAFFKPVNRNTTFEIENGQQVMALARVSLYEPRGDYQLIIQQLELLGDGKLQYAFEQLKRKLNQEGLFASEHKQPIPNIPKKIGIVTSATGAALQDMIKVLRRRFSAMPLVIYPCMVQGKQAAATICTAIETANERNECDTVIVARGGGSLEDLWPFNEEIVARALYNSQLPIITGIGHEIDTTIADLVADQRAATPSAAAELATPQQSELRQRLQQTMKQLQSNIQQQVEQHKQTIHHLQQRLAHPQQRIQQYMQKFDEIQQQLQRSISIQLQQRQQSLQHIQTVLKAHSPQQHIVNQKNTLQTLQQRLQHGVNQQVARDQQRVALAASKLQAHSPLDTLQRGYAIATDQQQHIVTDATTIPIGASIEIQLRKGKLGCTVETIN
jgi:exodeoxyribonuclease VII large subunit